MDTHQPLVVAYLTYATASFGLTVWLARTLFRNGQVFLEEVFAEHPQMAQAVNRLLVVGFYLLNFGYALLMLKTPHHHVTGTLDAIEILAGKLGALLLTLGGMHFLNLYIFHRIRRRAQLRMAPPPVAPQLHHPVNFAAAE